MPRMMITLSRDTKDRLVQTALTERRDPREQAALYVERELARQPPPDSMHQTHRRSDGE